MAHRTDSSPGLSGKRTTMALMAATVGLAVAALLVGISDNPPGIVLLYGAGLSLVLAVAHRWRGANRFGGLLLASVMGFIVMVVIHNFAEVGAERIAHLPLLAGLLSVTSVIGFIMAVIVCPMAGAVGLFGFAASLARGRGA